MCPAARCPPAVRAGRLPRVRRARWPALLALRGRWAWQRLVRDVNKRQLLCTWDFSLVFMSRSRGPGPSPLTWWQGSFMPGVAVTELCVGPGLRARGRSLRQRRERSLRRNFLFSQERLSRSVIVAATFSTGWDCGSEVGAGRRWWPPEAEPARGGPLRSSGCAAGELQQPRAWLCLRSGSGRPGFSPESHQCFLPKWPW